MLKKYSTTVSLGRNRYQTTIGIKQINFYNGHSWQLNSDTWIDSGIPARPHMIKDAPFMVSVTPDGLRRIHPTRENDVWFEMSGAKINQAGTWNVVQLGTPTSRVNNRITWNRSNFNAYVDMAGHYVKLAYLLKNGYLPPNNQFAYELSTNGLTRQGSTLLKDGVPVMHMRAPIAYDHDNPEDVRQIAHKIVRIDGKWHVIFTLPNLAGMSKPVIDPTLTLQPDAAAGKDNTIQLVIPGDNHGISTTFWPDVDRHALIEFDVSSIPTSGIVSSGTLTLKVISTSNHTTGLHKGLVEWFEGIKNAAPPGAEDGSTWDHKNANTGGQVVWTGGAGGAAGTEYTAGATTTFIPNSTGYKVITGLASDVQDWVTTPSNNYGWWTVHQGISDAWQFTTSDNATAAYRPELVTEWSDTKNSDKISQFYLLLFDKKKH